MCALLGATTAAGLGPAPRHGTWSPALSSCCCRLAPHSPPPRPSAAQELLCYAPTNDGLQNLAGDLAPLGCILHLEPYLQRG